MEKMNKRVMAVRHTTGIPESATLVEETDINHCKVRLHDGVLCTAVHNQYNGFYYADDKYGILNS